MIKYAAYAVYSPNDTTLYFVQAQEKNYNYTDTLVSKSGGNYTGTVYSGVEAERDITKKPSWVSNKNVTKVNIVDKIHPKTCSDMFNGLINLSTIEHISNIDTSNATNMKSMFYNCSALTSLDVSRFGTLNVTDMRWMFYGCSALTSLDLSSFNTSSVTDMSFMFRGCSGLKSLDLSSFNTSKVTNMSFMFRDCSGLKNLDLSSFDTSNVTSMQTTFYNCSDLTSLDLSSFDTSQVTNMKAIFYNCSALTSLDVSRFGTLNVTDMRWMFYGCSALTSLDLSSFDTSNVTNMSWIFGSCGKLRTIYCNSDWNNQKVTNSGNMFSDCASLFGGTSGQVKYDSSKIGIEMANPDTGYFTRKTGGFTLTKSCPEDTGTAFTFHVAMTGLAKNKTYTYGTSGSFTSDDSGMADVILELKDGGSVSFTGLPINATYQVTEDANACVASFKVTDANNLGLIATNKKANTEVQTALSTAKETVDDGENVTVTFTNSIKTYPISILKQDPDGGFVVGAKLQVKKGDTVVHEWTTVDSEEEEVNLAPGDYILHEAEAPKGFNQAAEIPFTIDDDGTIRTDVSDGETTTKQAVPNLVMVDERSTAKIQIRKTDGTNLLTGAALQILDSKGTVVDEWTSDGTVHETDLTLGATYTLHEKEAPKGYDYAEDITFTVPENSKGEVTIGGSTSANVTMVDTPLAQLPNSGATSDPWWLFGAAGCGLILANHYRRKKKKESEKKNGEPSAKS